MILAAILFGMLESPAIVTRPLEGMHPPLSAMSSVSITREPVPTPTPGVR